MGDGRWEMGDAKIRESVKEKAGERERGEQKSKNKE